MGATSLVKVAAFEPFFEPLLTTFEISPAPLAGSAMKQPTIAKPATARQINRFISVDLRTYFSGAGNKVKRVAK
jgi:hypothetical protein